MSEDQNYWQRLATRRTSRRSLIRAGVLGGLGLAGLSALGCSGSQPKQEVPSTGTTGSSAAQPKYGGTFSLFNRGDPPNLDPHTNSTVDTHYFTQMWYNGLVEWKSGPDIPASRMDPGPALAEKWEQPDPRTLIFTLRKGVMFHDGTEFTSDDAMFSLQRIGTKKAEFQQAFMMEPVEKVEAPDKYTVKITTREPNAPLLSYLACRYGAMVSRKVVEKTGDLKTTAVGTGPFKLDTHDRGVKIVSKKNPNYFLKDLPYADGVTHTIIADVSARQAAFRARQLDFLSGNKTDFDTISASVPNLVSFKEVATAWDHIDLRVDKPPMNDPKVRYAIHLAIDRQEFIKSIGMGEGVVEGPVPAAWGDWALPQEELLKMPGYRQPKDQDIAEAKRLMAAAGYADGLTMVATFSPVLTNNVAEGPIVKEQLKKIGIDLEMKVTSDHAVYSKLKVEGDFEMFFHTWSLLAEVDQYLTPQVSSTGSTNYGRVNDAKLDAMLKKQRETLNKAERQKLVNEVQRYLLSPEGCYIIPLWDAYTYHMVHPYVKNYLYPKGSEEPRRLQYAWLDK